MINGKKITVFSLKLDKSLFFTKYELKEILREHYHNMYDFDGIDSVI